jgi:predicted HicB family RNase H-like nuclease
MSGAGGTYMKNTMEYKGYIGTVEFSEEDALFFGKVVGIRALISYEGASAKALVNDFHEAVDDYIDFKEVIKNEN